MPFLPFQVSSANDFIAQPVASTKIVAVSSSAADAAKVLTIKGRDGGTPQSGTVTLNGLKEVIGTDDWTELSTISAGASLTGSVGIFGEGTAAIGDIRVDALPTNGQTLQVGLAGAGNFRTYTFRVPATYVLTFAEAGSVADMQGLYLDLRLGATTYRFWINYDGLGSAPADGGHTLVEVYVEPTVTTVASVAELIGNQIFAETSAAWSANPVGLALYVERAALGTATMTVNTGTMGSYLPGAVAGSAGTADAADQIRTSLFPNGSVAGAIRAALTAGSGAGSLYGTGTTANEYVSATVVGAVVTITDKIPCLRQLPWQVVSSSEALAVRTPVGGVNGTLLAYLTGTQQVSRPMNFNDPGLAETPLIALTTPTSDPVYQGGRPATLRLQSVDESTTLSVTLEVSDDLIHWSSIYTENIDGDNFHVSLPPFEFVRLVVDANTRTVDRALHAGIVVF